MCSLKGHLYRPWTFMVAAPGLVAAGYIKSMETGMRCLSKPQTRSAPFPNMEPHLQTQEMLPGSPGLGHRQGCLRSRCKLWVQHWLAGVQVWFLPALFCSHHPKHEAVLSPGDTMWKWRMSCRVTEGNMESRLWFSVQVSILGFEPLLGPS